MFNSNIMKTIGNVAVYGSMALGAYYAFAKLKGFRLLDAQGKPFKLMEKVPKIVMQQEGSANQNNYANSEPIPNNETINKNQIINTDGKVIELQ